MSIIFRSEENFQEFVNSWSETDAVSENCEIMRWCRSIGPSLSIKQGRVEFLDLIRDFPSIARTSHYHIGFMLYSKIRTQWILATARAPMQALLMLENDATINERHINILRESIENSNAPSIIARYQNLVLPDRAIYNDSKIAIDYVGKYGTP